MRWRRSVSRCKARFQSLTGRLKTVAQGSELPLQRVGISVEQPVVACGGDFWGLPRLQSVLKLLDDNRFDRLAVLACRRDPVPLRHPIPTHLPYLILATHR